ncbi:MAG: sigma-70 family RNA polymerase sigma factor [Oscillospiraceae bacterium]|nr:sigma-70 family RNA polymerase sigma factor [Oscillospiraceae bacterium]
MEPRNAAETEQAREPAFLELVYLQYKRLMFSVAGRYTGSLDDQADIVGEALVKMAEQEARLRAVDERALTTYIAAMVRNTAINFLRHRGVIRQHEQVSWEEMQGAEPSPAPSPEETILQAERRDLVRQVWLRLSPSDRLLLEGKYILDLTDRELAATLGCGTTSIRMKLTRARRRALREMQKEGDCNA